MFERWFPSTTISTQCLGVLPSSTTFQQHKTRLIFFFQHSSLQQNRLDFLFLPFVLIFRLFVLLCVCVYFNSTLLHFDLSKMKSDVDWDHWRCCRSFSSHRSEINIDVRSTYKWKINFLQSISRYLSIIIVGDTLLLQGSANGSIVIDPRTNSLERTLPSQGILPATPSHVHNKVKFYPIPNRKMIRRKADARNFHYCVDPLHSTTASSRWKSWVRGDLLEDTRVLKVNLTRIVEKQQLSFCSAQQEEMTSRWQNGLDDHDYSWIFVSSVFTLPMRGARTASKVSPCSSRWSSIEPTKRNYRPTAFIFSLYTWNCILLSSLMSNMAVRCNSIYALCIIIILLNCCYLSSSRLSLASFFFIVVLRSMKSRK